MQLLFICMQCNIWQFLNLFFIYFIYHNKKNEANKQKNNKVSNVFSWTFFSDFSLPGGKILLPGQWTQEGGWDWRIANGPEDVLAAVIVTVTGAKTNNHVSVRKITLHAAVKRSVLTCEELPVPSHRLKTRRRTSHWDRKECWSTHAVPAEIIWLKWLWP